MGLVDTALIAAPLPRPPRALRHGGPSTGSAWPDTPVVKQLTGGVALFDAEDDDADTFAPRLDRLGAEDRTIVAVEGVATLGQRPMKIIRQLGT